MGLVTPTRRAMSSIDASAYPRSAKTSSATSSIWRSRSARGTRRRLTESVVGAVPAGGAVPVGVAEVAMPWRLHLFHQELTSSTLPVVSQLEASTMQAEGTRH